MHNSNYVIIPINGEKITIEAFFCEVKEDKLLCYYQDMSIVATFFIRNIVGFYEIR
jgi:hypothetical protein